MEPSRITFRLLVHAILLSFVLFTIASCSTNQSQSPKKGPDKAPGSWMYNQRAFPNGINREAKAAAIKQHKLMATSRRSSFDNEWEAVGPINIGGRMTDVSLHPTEKDIMYAGSSVGGVWRSVDRGFEWELVFEEPGGISIGNIEVSRHDPNIIYVGTGEANGSATSGAFFGNGMYKSTDAGNTWENIGLPKSDHIGRILVHPEDSDIVFVAVAGKLYDKNPERGVYKTVDGGETWDRTLFVSDSTSVIDISMSPLEPDVLFASTWERTRFPSFRVYGGVTSGLHRSRDGGETWELLTNDLPQPNESTGRIGVFVAPSDPNIVYASYTFNATSNVFDGLYRSNDQGDTWTRYGDELADIYRTFGWFFGNVRVSPTNPDEAYVMGLDTYQTLNGGVTWNEWTLNSVHVDQHGMEFHDTDSDFVVIANDGGLYITENKGLSFRHVETIANNQFYECVIHPTLPKTYFGGAQDNGTLLTRDNGEGGYLRISGGDGFTIKFDDVNPDLYYVTSQFGNIRRSTSLDPFQDTNIRPGGNFVSRNNWNTPFVTIPNQENGILYGGERLLSSADRGETWEIISPDLTNGPHGTSTSFGTISSIAISELDPELIVVGTDDGNVQITTDGGLSWILVSDDLPLLSVSSVATDPFDASTIYVTYSGYAKNNYLPHILRSSDLGVTWTDIGSTLPESPINEIVIDPSLTDHYYVASDESVYFTDNGGDSWGILGIDLPLSIFADLDIHAENRELLAASFGRSMFSYELPTEQVSSTVDGLENSIKIFPNPTSDFITIDQADIGDIIEVMILDISGRMIKNVSAHLKTIDVSNLESGHYLLRLITEEGIVSKKFSKI